MSKNKKFVVEVAVTAGTFAAKKAISAWVKNTLITAASSSTGMGITKITVRKIDMD